MPMPNVGGWLKNLWGGVKANPVGAAGTGAIVGSMLYSGGQAAGLWGQTDKENAAADQVHNRKQQLASSLPVSTVAGLSKPFATSGGTHNYVGPGAQTYMTRTAAALANPVELKALEFGLDLFCKEAGFDGEDRDVLFELVKEAAGRFPVPRGTFIPQNGLPMGGQKVTSPLSVQTRNAAGQGMSGSISPKYLANARAIAANNAARKFTVNPQQKIPTVKPEITSALGGKGSASAKATQAIDDKLSGREGKVKGPDNSFDPEAALGSSLGTSLQGAPETRFSMDKFLRPNAAQPVTPLKAPAAQPVPPAEAAAHLQASSKARAAGPNLDLAPGQLPSAGGNKFNPDLGTPPASSATASASPAAKSLMDRAVGAARSGGSPSGGGRTQPSPFEGGPRVGRGMMPFDSSNQDIRNFKNPGAPAAPTAPASSPRVNAHKIIGDKINQPLPTSQAARTAVPGDPAGGGGGGGLKALGMLGGAAGLGLYGYNKATEGGTISPFAPADIQELQRKAHRYDWEDRAHVPHGGAAGASKSGGDPFDFSSEMKADFGTGGNNMGSVGARDRLNASEFIKDYNSRGGAKRIMQGMINPSGYNDRSAWLQHLNPYLQKAYAGRPGTYEAIQKEFDPKTPDSHFK